MEFKYKGHRIRLYKRNADYYSVWYGKFKTPRGFVKAKTVKAAADQVKDYFDRRELKRR